MDVEFVTDRDTDAALLEWYARSRREVFSGTSFILFVGSLAFLDVILLWDGTSRRSLAFLGSMLLLIGAIAIMAVARDPQRRPALRFPQTELLAGGLVVASLVGTFEHHVSILSFLLLLGALVAWAALLMRFAYLYPILRDFLPASASAIHVRVDAEGIEYTMRPHEPRHIAWKSVRSIEGDGRMLYIGAGLQPIIVPRRAFAAEAQWRQFIETVRARAAEDLRPKKRSPISPYAGGFEARTASLGPLPFEPRHGARRARGSHGRASGRR
jgi:hypothetical protein